MKNNCLPEVGEFKITTLFSKIFLFFEQNILKHSLRANWQEETCNRMHHCDVNFTKSRRATRILLRRGASLNQKLEFFVRRMSHLGGAPTKVVQLMRVTGGGLGAKPQPPKVIGAWERSPKPLRNFL